MSNSPRLESQDDVSRLARGYLRILQNGLQPEVVELADDLLTYFNRLQDRFNVVKSASPRFSSTTFGVLHQIVYELESNPDFVLTSDQKRGELIHVLEDLALGRVTLAAKRRRKV